MEALAPGKPKVDLTIRQRRMVHGIVVQGLSASEAYRRAGYQCKSHADSAAANVLAGMGVREYLAAVTSEAGLSEEALSAHLREGCNATKTGMSSDGKSVELGPDWPTRLRYIELAMRMRGMLR